jgi:hypothetical protein
MSKIEDSITSSHPLYPCIVKTIQSVSLSRFLIIVGPYPSALPQPNFSLTMSSLNFQSFSAACASVLHAGAWSLI